MRYADGGGLTAERRAAREGIRLEAGRRFARGDRNSVIAKDLRVSERSVEQWRRNWREGGMEGLKSKGPAKLPKLSDDRFALLEKGLGKGPAAHGWEDQRWTLERVRTLIGRQVTSTRSSSGRRTCGRRWKHRGGARGLGRLRGRGRVRDDAATRPHLGPARTDSRGESARPVPAADLDRRDVLLAN